MILWRITRTPYQALDGEGARLYGGRWNSEGVSVVYGSASLSLAALEYLVHVDLEDVPADLVAMRIEVPKDAGISRISSDELPTGWNLTPSRPECVEIGDAWAHKGAELMLHAPSAIIPEEYNVLVNPRHPHAKHVRVVGTRPFAYDPRLLA